VIRILAALLVVVLGVGSTRDILCQLACAEPDAAHAAAACHETGDRGGTLLQTAEDPCLALDAAPATTIKGAAAKEQRSVTATRAPVNSGPLSPPVRLDVRRLVCSSAAHCSAILRI
jgi:hypothetical protein